jgi:hypothetical protein
MSGTATIFGRVLDMDTMEPVPNELVLLMRPSGPAGGMPVVTDSQGRFVFARIWTGTSVLATAGGRRFVHLDEHERLDDVVLLTMRMASIAGRVVDDVGAPIQGRSMTAYRTAPINRRATLQQFGTAVTDDRGRYVFPALVRGDYVICACDWHRGPVDPALVSLMGSGPAVGRLATPLQIDANMPMYPQTFHPAANRPDEAVSVASGEERSGIDVVIRAVPGRRVTGIVAGGPTGLRAEGVRLWAANAAGPLPLRPRMPMIVHPDGRFEFDQVPAGDYILSVRLDDFGPAAEATGDAFTWLNPTPPRQEPPLRNQAAWFADQPVSVGSRDVLNLQVPVAAAHTVTGSLEFLSPEGRPQGPGAGAATRLVLAGILDGPGSGVNSAVNATINPDGTFELGPVVPGEYFFRWPVASTAPWVATVHAGSRDITDIPLVVGDGIVPPLRVVMTSEPRATLRGTVTTSTVATEVLRTVAVFPQDRSLWNALPASARRFKFEHIDPRGQFVVTGLPPGDYFVAAVSSNPLWAASGSDLPDFEQAAAGAVPVTVVSGDNPPIVVRR